jgi:hypothetical protein
MCLCLSLSLGLSLGLGSLSLGLCGGRGCCLLQLLGVVLALMLWLARSTTLPLLLLPITRDL